MATTKLVKSIAVASVMVTGLSVQTPVALAQDSFSSEYVFSAIGLRIGRTKVSAKINDKSYTLNGNMKAAGVASLFSAMSGNLTAKGAWSPNAVIASSYDVKYKEGKKAKSTAIRFKSGSVTSAVNKPNKDRSKRKDWVPHKAGSLKNTIDPATAMLVPAKSMRDVCNRTIRVFDGVLRADLKLSYLRTIPYSVDGYKGDAVTCRAKFVPISGYQSKKKDIAYMRDKSRIEVSFAPVGDTGLYAPVSARADTRIGVLAMRATRFRQGS